MQATRGPTALWLALALGGCSVEQQAWAGRITSPAQLVGGPRTLGIVGDYRISNGRVRFVVQGLDLHPGVAGDRAFAATGGQLIDADLARPEEERDPRLQGNGHDGLGEIFPLFFLQGMHADSIEVLDDGSTGLFAHLRVSGHGSPIFTATQFLNDRFLGLNAPDLRFYVDYQLAPGDDFLRITASMRNASSTGALSFLSDTVPLPIGFISLFGEGQPLFLPGETGYDVRFTLGKSYRRSYSLPAMAGITTDLVAVEGSGISYGLSYCDSCAGPADLNPLPPSASFVWKHQPTYAQYAPVSSQSLLLPFVSGSMLGLFFGEIPTSLPPRVAVSATVKLRVAGPSPSSQLDAMLLEQRRAVGTVAGLVREERSLLPVEGASVVLFAASGTAPGTAGLAATTARTDAGGRFSALLPPGEYDAVVRRSPRTDSAPFRIRVERGQTAWIQKELERMATLAVEVVDETGRRIPAKVTVDAAYDRRGADASQDPDPKTFLYDLRVGDRYLPTDLVPDTADPETRRFVENTFHTVDGRAEGQVRACRPFDAAPGNCAWRVTASRGPAWEVVSRPVTLAAGEVTRLAVSLHRLLPARGRISGDQHVHTNASVDADPTFEERARSAAAEGLDWFATTDHNVLTDLGPTIQRVGLQDFLAASVGEELSTLEAGHTSAYPLRWLPDWPDHGTVAWFGERPTAIHQALRARAGAPLDQFVVQVNHPRDSVQGLFTAYGMTGDGLTGDPAHDWPPQSSLTAPTGSAFGAGAFDGVLDEIDAMEVLNDKRMDLARTYRVPPLAQLATLAKSPPGLPGKCTDPSPPKPCLGVPGSIVRDGSGRVAFPGAFEDWEHLLDFGKRIVALGNSDSHSLLNGEVGYPRNLIDLGHDPETARQIDPGEVARAIKAGRVVATYGPEIRLTVFDPARRGPDGLPLEVPIGYLVQPAPPSATTTGWTLTAHLVVDAAPWIDVSGASILLGRPAPCDEDQADCRETRINLPSFPAGARPVRRLDRTFPLVLPANPGKPRPADSWVAAYVWGDAPMWPVVIPQEVPPLLLNDAIAALTASLPSQFVGKLGLDGLGTLRPTQVGPTRPYAVTNPVFVDGDGDGRWHGQAIGAWTPPAAQALGR